MTFRQLKLRILEALKAEYLETSLGFIQTLVPQQAVSPLFSLLHHSNTLVRWRAVSAMGEAVALLASESFERARIIMRRLMWNLNDESGGIGWGSPEAMGEIMARQKRLAREYAAILVSYLNPRGNYLEHEGLQQGVLWGLGRLAGVFPEMVREAPPFILPFLSSSNPALRGLGVQSYASWVSGLRVVTPKA